MYRCIVTPVDGEAFGEHALPYAASIARRTGATLHLAHVHVPMAPPSGVETTPLPGAWQATARERELGYLEGLAERIRQSHGVRVATSLVDGPVAPALLRHIGECGAGLVVMSTHGHFRFRRLWHHGVAEQLARELTVPTLLVHPADAATDPDLASDRPLRHILIALDGTPESESVLRHAVSVGRPFQARYTLLRVVVAREEARARTGEGSGRRLYQRHAAALQYLHSAAERLRAAGLGVRTEVLVADEIGPAIVGYATALPPAAGPIDLLALEARRHRPWSRIVGVHTTDAVVNASSLPVLLHNAGPDPEAALASTPALAARA